MNVWLVSETVHGDFLEWWSSGVCVVTFKCDCQMKDLQEAKALLNRIKAEPIVTKD